MKIRLILATTVLAASVAVPALGSGARKTSGTVWAALTHTQGGDIVVAGDFKDSLFGRGAIVYTTRVSTGPSQGSFTVKARKITIYTTAGSLSGAGAATQTNAGSKVTVSNGTFKLTKGTGAFKGHRFTGTFSGSMNNGVYTFTYRGTYR